MKNTLPACTDKLTILVNSCDAYEDLWMPCFTLLKRYWPDPDTAIVLNTETKQYRMDGLHIDCANFPEGDSYGARIRNALKHIHTEYVLLMLDDFFLRQMVRMEEICQIISWMDADSEIVCFNSEAMDLYTELDNRSYPGYRRVPPGNDYSLNMQAAIWRVEALKKYWEPDSSPWEWEEFSSALTGVYLSDKIYCRAEDKPPFIDYGHYRTGDLWAVVAGKWILEDVEPLFRREGISVDFSIRGEYVPECSNGRFTQNMSRRDKFQFISRCLGKKLAVMHLFFCIDCKLRLLFGKEVNDDFLSFLKQRGKSFVAKIQQNQKQ